MGARGSEVPVAAPGLLAVPVAAGHDAVGTMRFPAPGQPSQFGSHDKREARGAATNRPRLRCDGGRFTCQVVPCWVLE